MSQENANPYLDPANNSTLLGLMRVAFNNLLMTSNNALPAKVISYDRTSNRAKVQPMIKMINTNNKSFSRSQIESVPVFQYGGGGFILSINLKSGDLGWIIACDRDISQFLQNYSEAIPNTYRKKDFADSFFLPNPMSGYSTAEEDQENAVLQNLDGSVKISLGMDSIKIKSQNIIVEGQEINVMCENVNMTVSNDVKITTPTFKVVGNIEATGTITPNVPP
jgi:hypothetical protein